MMNAIRQEWANVAIYREGQLSRYKRMVVKYGRFQHGLKVRVCYYGRFEKLERPISIAKNGTYRLDI